MPQGIDKRIIKSRRALLHALPAVLRDKPLEKVTVREIAEAAGVNRKTFYAHYATPADLHADLARDIADSVVRRMGRKRLYTLADFTAAAAALASDYPEEFRALLTSPYLTPLRDRIVEILRTALADMLFPAAEQAELLTSYLLGSTLSLYDAYFRSSLSLPALQELHLRLLTRGLA